MSQQLEALLQQSSAVILRKVDMLRTTNDILLDFNVHVQRANQIAGRDRVQGDAQLHTLSKCKSVQALQCKSVQAVQPSTWQQQSLSLLEQQNSLIHKLLSSLQQQQFQHHQTSTLLNQHYQLSSSPSSPTQQFKLNSALREKQQLQLQHRETLLQIKQKELQLSQKKQKGMVINQQLKSMIAQHREQEQQLQKIHETLQDYKISNHSQEQQYHSKALRIKDLQHQINIEIAKRYDSLRITMDKDQEFAKAKIAVQEVNEEIGAVEAILKDYQSQMIEQQRHTIQMSQLRATLHGIKHLENSH